jgi:hypothetical protein
MHSLSFFVHRLLSFMKRKGIRRSLFAAAVFAALVLAGAVRVDAEEEKLPDKFVVRLGGYSIKDYSAIVRLDANNSPVGTYVDFHDTLGGETRAMVFRLDGLYRFTERSGLGFAWYDVRFRGSRVLSEQIVWNGQTYDIGTPVDTSIKFTVYKVNYQYSVFHDEEVELDASIGLHIMHIQAGIEASGINQSQGDSVTEPLPVWGLFADYKFTPRFSAFYNYQVFFINYQDKVKGGLQDFLFGLEYRLTKHIALGGAYNRFALNVKAQGNDATLYLDTN